MQSHARTHHIELRSNYHADDSFFDDAVDVWQTPSQPSLAEVIFAVIKQTQSHLISLTSPTQA